MNQPRLRASLSLRLCSPSDTERICLLEIYEFINLGCHDALEPKSSSAALWRVPYTSFRWRTCAPPPEPHTHRDYAIFGALTRRGLKAVTTASLQPFFNFVTSQCGLCWGEKEFRRGRVRSLHELNSSSSRERFFRM
jgi:hypothetical protein